MLLNRPTRLPSPLFFVKPQAPPLSGMSPPPSSLLLLGSLFVGGVAAAGTTGPCDIFYSLNTPCVAAHSTTRALYGSYSGALYQVTRSSDNRTIDIPLLGVGGFANAAVQDAFCVATACVITALYDQSPQGNHLALAPPGGAHHAPDGGVNASRFPTTIGGGNKVYGMFFEGGMGYRRDNTRRVATGDDPETLYMVTDGTHVNAGCCFDYGNAETDNSDNGPGTMESVYFGTSSEWGRGAGTGPWVMGDLEDGLWAGNVTPTTTNTPLPYPFVTAMVKGGTDGFAIKGSDATQGTFTTMFDGPRPKGYQPMRKQGAIILVRGWSTVPALRVPCDR